MTTTQATAPATRRISMRPWLIAAAVVMAVTIPVLPLRFMGVPGPDLNMNQVVINSKAWLSRVTGVAPKTDNSTKSTLGNSPADQVKMLDSAAQTLSLEIDKNPNEPALHNRIGLVYLSLGELDEACTHFDKAVALSRSGLAAVTGRMSAFKRSGNTQQASEALLEASKLNVELSAAHTNLARVYEKRGEHDKVIAELDLLNKEGNLIEDAVSETASSPRKKIMNPAVAVNLARAEAYINARQWQQAAEEYKKVLAQDNSVSLAHHRLGTILAMTGNAPMAVSELESAAELDPGSAEIESDLGIAYQTINVIPQAIRSYERAMALDQHSVDAAINLSNIYSAQGRAQEAIAVLTQATRDNPKSAKAHNNLGTLLSLQGKQRYALDEFQKALALAPTMASAHYGLGEVLLQTKSYMPAVQEFKQALTLSPNFSAAQLKMEEAYRKANMSVGSAEALN